MGHVMTSTKYKHWVSQCMPQPVCASSTFELANILSAFVIALHRSGSLSLVIRLPVCKVRKPQKSASPISFSSSHRGETFVYEESDKSSCVCEIASLNCAHKTTAQIILPGLSQSLPGHLITAAPCPATPLAADFHYGHTKPASEQAGGRRPRR